MREFVNLSTSHAEGSNEIRRDKKTRRKQEGSPLQFNSIELIQFIPRTSRRMKKTLERTEQHSILGQVVTINPHAPIPTPFEQGGGHAYTTVENHVPPGYTYPATSRPSVLRIRGNKETLHTQNSDKERSDGLIAIYPRLQRVPRHTLRPGIDARVKRVGWRHIV